MRSLRSRCQVERAPGGTPRRGGGRGRAVGWAGAPGTPCAPWDTPAGSPHAVCTAAPCARPGPAGATGPRTARTRSHAPFCRQHLGQRSAPRTSACVRSTCSGMRLSVDLSAPGSSCKRCLLIHAYFQKTLQFYYFIRLEMYYFLRLVYFFIYSFWVYYVLI